MWYYIDGDVIELVVAGVNGVTVDALAVRGLKWRAKSRCCLHHLFSLQLINLQRFYLVAIVILADALIYWFTGGANCPLRSYIDCFREQLVTLGTRNLGSLVTADRKVLQQDAAPLSFWLEFKDPLLWEVLGISHLLAGLIRKGILIERLGLHIGTWVRQIILKVILDAQYKVVELVLICWVAHCWADLLGIWLEFNNDCKLTLFLFF